MREVPVLCAFFICHAVKVGGLAYNRLFLLSLLPLSPSQYYGIKANRLFYPPKQLPPTIPPRLFFEMHFSSIVLFFLPAFSLALALPYTVNRNADVIDVGFFFTLKLVFPC